MSDINISIQKTLVHEGGFQNDHNDRANWTGGEIGVGTLAGTKYGITALDLPGVDIQNLTVDQAIAYYKEHYVKQAYAQVTSQNVLDKLFDMGVLFGVGTAIEVIQQAVNIAVDGAFGPGTLQAVNTAGDSLLQPYKTALVQHVLKVIAARPEDKEFFQGWVNRINS